MAETLFTQFSKCSLRIDDFEVRKCAAVIPLLGQIKRADRFRK